MIDSPRAPEPAGEVPAGRTAPPTWAVRTVRCCVVGILALPLAVPLLLAATSGIGPGADPFRRAGFFVSVAAWVGFVVAAQWLTTAYPPVPRRR